MPNEDYRRQYFAALQECREAVDKMLPLYQKLMDSLETKEPYYLSEDEFLRLQTVSENYRNFLEIARHPD